MERGRPRRRGSESSKGAGIEITKPGEKQKFSYKAIYGFSVLVFFCVWGSVDENNGIDRWSAGGAKYSLFNLRLEFPPIFFLSS